ncbi:hypothetical protein [Methylobacterium sp. WL19]|uniref:hypothetical protein n=1 Tax=Methylobacterium sp. WL19 TaxID=2603896 RepID=UPI0011CCC705|nr:hypothetical protein [Methylobacterium sp. WL19]TXN33928.1 hypothetical protein FV220_00325 [Methylobacterium sp. WL19]
MIAAPHQQKLKLDWLPSRLAGRVESVVDGFLAGTPSAVNYPNVLNALNILSVGHAVPSLPVVDDQSTTGAMVCGATRIAFPNNPRDA